MKSSPPRPALLDGILARELDQLRMDRVADPPHDLLLNRLDLIADLGREVPAPPMIESGHLGEAAASP